MNLKKSLLLAILSGILTFCAFPNFWSPDYHFYPLIWFAHIPLLFALENQSLKHSFWLGALCGAVVNVGGYYWIADLIYTFGHLPWPVAYLGMFLHSFYIGLIWAFWALGYQVLRKKLGVWTTPLLMVCLEHYLPRIFPAYMGNSQFPWLSVMQVIDLLGVSAVSFLIYWFNAQVYEEWVYRIKEQKFLFGRNSKLLMIALVCTLIYGWFRIDQIDQIVKDVEHLKVGVVQGNVGIFQTESREKRKNHLLIQQKLSAQAQAQGAELIVWSESSYRAASLDYRSTEILKSSLPLELPASSSLKPTKLDMITPLRGFSTPLLMGLGPVDRSETDNRFLHYNSAWLIDQDGKITGKYDKNYRLAFGEYIPFGDLFPVFYQWLPAASHLERGYSLNILPFEHKGSTLKLGVLICYEGILPNFALDFASLDPHIIFNLTNDDWFNLKAERYLHLTLAIPRAIEHRKSMVRGTLTGVSVSIDPVGRLRKMTEMETETILVDDVPLLQGTTIYAQFGHWFVTICLLIVLYALLPLIFAKKNQSLS
jgi:apolipoprotein N-acyltransferase